MNDALMNRDDIMFDEDLLFHDYNDFEDAAWHLQEACEYLAKAADTEGWRGICIYSTALLHYSIKQRYPDAVCDMVVGWGNSSPVDTRKSKFPDRPLDGWLNGGGGQAAYAHYWLELQGLNEIGLFRVHRFDCAELSNRHFTDPFDLLLPTAYLVGYHPVRRNRRVLPAIYPDELPAGKGSLYFSNSTVESMQREVFGRTPEELVIDANEDPLWRPGMIRRIVDESDGLLVMPS